MKRKISVIILAAGRGRRMEKVLQSRKFHIPKSLLETGKSPVIAEIINRLENLLKNNDFQLENLQIIINKNKAGQNLKSFICQYYSLSPLGEKIKFYCQKDFSGPLVGALSARVKNGPALLWLSDTLISDQNLKLAPDCLYVSRVFDNFQRWCLAETNQRGQIIKFLDKPEKYSQKSGLSLIGLYLLSDYPFFKASGRKVLAKKKKIRGEYQLSSAFEIYNKKKPLKTMEVNEWLDTGDPASFLDAKEKFLNDISLSRLKIDGQTMTLTKNLAGRNKKLADELFWFQRVERVKRIISFPKFELPKQIKLVSDEKMVLPYYNWPTLADWYLFRSLFLPKESATVFNNFLNLISRLHEYKSKNSIKQSTALNRSMLVEKTTNRLKIFFKERRTNDKSFPNKKLINDWLKLEQKFFILADKYLIGNKNHCLIHGDLILSNVLAQDKNNFIFLDPRGSYGGRQSIFGDPYYDYAKIYQSIFTSYESIIRNEFVFEKDADQNYIFRSPLDNFPGRKIWQRAFLDFCSKNEIEIDRVKFFSVSLLFSLLPLYLKKGRVSEIIYRKAIQILSEF